MNRSLLFLILISTFQTVWSCSMISFVDASGKTWVGNNEDYFDPDTWMWTLRKGKHPYGAVYFGYGNFFAQGGMNEAGLIFDGFAMEAKEVLNIKGKKKTNPSKLVDEIMHSCMTVQEVKEVLLRYQLDFLENAQLMFVDKTGASLIVEGDEILLKEAEDYRICTNFYQSEIHSHQDIRCDRYLSGHRLMEGSTREERGKQLCMEALNSMHQEGMWGGTQYSNIYDPQQGIVYLYLFHNFDEEVKLSIQEVLAKKQEPQQLSDFFEQTNRYQSFKTVYQKADTYTQTVEDAKTTEELMPALQQIRHLEQVRLFSNRLFSAMDQQLQDKQWEMALQTGLACTDIFPNTWQVHAILSKAYYEKDMLEEAESHIVQALNLNPEDPELLKAKKKIQSNR